MDQFSYVAGFVGETLLLDCCHFELDRRGKEINCHNRERAPDHPPTP